LLHCAQNLPQYQFARDTVKVMAAGAGAESANVLKGVKTTAPATKAAARTDDVTNFPRANIFVSYFSER
jgi:hypothetical protein